LTLQRYARFFVFPTNLAFFSVSYSDNQTIMRQIGENTPNLVAKPRFFDRKTMIFAHNLGKSLLFDRKYLKK
jgi:hypothetical protein